MKRLAKLCTTFLLIICLFACAFPSETVQAKSKKKKPSGRYIVTCNHHYDNKYNTLGKYKTIESARKKIKKQSKDIRGEWYVYDKKTKKIVWPDLSTDKKKVKKTIAWAKAVANDNKRHGFTCVGERTRNGCSLKWDRWGKNEDYACSTVVETAYELFGFFNARTYSWKHNLKLRAGGLGYIRGYSSQTIAAALKGSKKFKNVTTEYRKKGKKMLRAGDILITSSQFHTAMMVTSRTLIEGAGNETGREFAPGRPGDQKGGNEIRKIGFYNGFGIVYRPKY
ncbi:MAG: hypothetical protein IJG17_09170 [Eubacterium sp.]|nr:hypothetical protein [Eubacterium sp.]